MAENVFEIDFSKGPRSWHELDLGAPYCLLTWRSLPGPLFVSFAPGEPKIPVQENEPWDLGREVTKIYISHEKGSGAAEFIASDRLSIDPSGGGGDTEGLAPDRRIAFQSTVQALNNAGGRNALIFPDQITRNITISNGGHVYTPGHAYVDSAGSDLSGFLQECPANLNDNCRATQNVVGWYPGLGMYASPHGMDLPENRDHYHYLRSRVMLQHSAGIGPAECFFGIGDYRRAFNDTTSAIGFFANPGGGETVWKAGVHFRDEGGTAKFFVEESLTGFPFADEVYDLEVRIGTEGDARYIRWFIGGDQVHERSLPFTDRFYDDQSTQPRIYLERKNGNDTDWIQLWSHLAGIWEGGTVWE